MKKTAHHILLFLVLLIPVLLLLRGDDDPPTDEDLSPPVTTIEFVPPTIEEDKKEEATLHPLNEEMAAEGFVNMHNPPYDKFFFDMRYAKDTNFTGKVIYPTDTCYLRKNAANALLEAYNTAQKQPQPLTFIIYDCYRPQSYHRKLWEAYPNPSYVAMPKKGSRHSRGMAVDLGLAYMNGEILPMPTDFDTFSPLAHMDYEGEELDVEARVNRELLKKIMTDAGFTYTRTEWWHFDKTGWQDFPLSDVKP
ncbi:D-alanyl-D-alanine dipeptidase [Elusimicrobium simillimum]|uniref:M15 family metallopeptidase n=1 Tax=Elusimicrobium simillimum TaxID=3143438 RepID=UPI003C705D62